jgi:hypothetical protein
MIILSQPEGPPGSEVGADMAQLLSVVRLMTLADACQL